MDLNSILFPAPKSSYTIESLKGLLVWVPKYKTDYTNNNENNMPVGLRHQSTNSLSYGSRMLQNKSRISVTSPKHKLECKNIEIDDNLKQSKTSKLSAHFTFDSKNQNSISSHNQPKAKNSSKTLAPLANLNSSRQSIDDSCADMRSEDNLATLEITEKPCNIENKMPSTLIKRLPQKPLKTKVSLSLPLHIVTDRLKTDACNTSLSNFDPDHTDEYSETHYQTSPRTFFKYTSIILSNPIERANANCKKQRTQENTMKNIQMTEASMCKSPMSVMSQTQCFSSRSELKAPRMFGANCISPQKPNIDAVKELAGYIPCMLLKPELPSDKIMLYFHGNAEDIGLAYDLLDHIRSSLSVTKIPLMQLLINN